MKLNVRVGAAPSIRTASRLAAMTVLLTTFGRGGVRAVASAAASSVALRRTGGAPTAAAAFASCRPTLRGAEVGGTAAAAAADRCPTALTPRVAAFGIRPDQYRSSIVRDFSVAAGGAPPSDGSSAADGDGGGGVATADAEPKPRRPPTLTSAVQAAASASASSSSFAADPYALPPPRAGDDLITDLRPGRRIVALGDVHGDINALRNFLVTAGVMDPESDVDEPVWSGGDTICVQCGDVLDRGDDELACLRLLAGLAWQARDAGGDLILLYGNHESLNTAGLFQYANPGGNYEFEAEVGRGIDAALGTNRWRLMFAGNQPSRWAAFEPGGLLADNTLANMKVAVVVGRTVFVHAGLTAEHLREYGGIENMNKMARDWIVQPHHGEHNYEGKYETVAEVVESAQKRARGAMRKMPDCLGGGMGAHSPVWMRDYSNPNDDVPKNPSAQRMIDEALAEVGHGVRRMVIGHTPQHQINAALRGKAWRVDVGASQGVMGGAPEVLEIIHGGDEEEDVVSVLTMTGERVPGAQRQVLERLF